MSRLADAPLATNAIDMPPAKQEGVAVDSTSLVPSTTLSRSEDTTTVVPAIARAVVMGTGGPSRMVWAPLPLPAPANISVFWPCLWFPESHIVAAFVSPGSNPLQATQIQAMRIAPAPTDAADVPRATPEELALVLGRVGNFNYLEAWTSENFKRLSEGVVATGPLVGSPVTDPGIQSALTKALSGIQALGPVLAERRAPSAASRGTSPAPRAPKASKLSANRPASTASPVAPLAPAAPGAAPSETPPAAPEATEPPAGDAAETGAPAPAAAGSLPAKSGKPASSGVYAARKMKKLQTEQAVAAAAEQGIPYVPPPARKRGPQPGGTGASKRRKSALAGPSTGASVALAANLSYAAASRPFGHSPITPLPWVSMSLLRVWDFCWLFHNYLALEPGLSPESVYSALLAPRPTPLLSRMLAGLVSRVSLGIAEPETAPSSDRASIASEDSMFKALDKWDFDLQEGHLRLKPGHACSVMTYPVLLASLHSAKIVSFGKVPDSIEDRLRLLDQLVLHLVCGTNLVRERRRVAVEESLSVEFRLAHSLNWQPSSGSPAPGDAGDDEPIPEDPSVEIGVFSMDRLPTEESKRRGSELGSKLLDAAAMGDPMILETEIESAKDNGHEGVDPVTGRTRWRTYELSTAVQAEEQAALRARCLVQRFRIGRRLNAYLGRDSQGRRAYVFEGDGDEDSGVRVFFEDPSSPTNNWSCVQGRRSILDIANELARVEGDSAALAERLYEVAASSAASCRPFTFHSAREARLSGWRFYEDDLVKCSMRARLPPPFNLVLDGVVAAWKPLHPSGETDERVYKIVFDKSSWETSDVLPGVSNHDLLVDAWRSIGGLLIPRYGPDPAQAVLQTVVFDRRRTEEMVRHRKTSSWGGEFVLSPELIKHGWVPVSIPRAPPPPSHPTSPEPQSSPGSTRSNSPTNASEASGASSELTVSKRSDYVVVQLPSRRIARGYVVATRRSSHSLQMRGDGSRSVSPEPRKPANHASADDAHDDEDEDALVLADGEEGLIVLSGRRAIRDASPDRFPVHPRRFRPLTHLARSNTPFSEVAHGIQLFWQAHVEPNFERIAVALLGEDAVRPPPAASSLSNLERLAAAAMIGASSLEPEPTKPAEQAATKEASSATEKKDTPLQAIFRYALTTRQMPQLKWDLSPAQHDGEDLPPSNVSANLLLLEEALSHLSARAPALTFWARPNESDDRGFQEKWRKHMDSTRDASELFAGLECLAEFFATEINTMNHRMQLLQQQQAASSADASPASSP